MKSGPIDLAGLNSPPENGAIAIAMAPFIAPITTPLVSYFVRQTGKIRVSFCASSG
jgi:hypothetical protein